MRGMQALAPTVAKSAVHNWKDRKAIWGWMGVHVAGSHCRTEHR